MTPKAYDACLNHHHLSLSLSLSLSLREQTYSTQMSPEAHDTARIIIKTPLKRIANHHELKASKQASYR
jgi:hypothetical protein